MRHIHRPLGLLALLALAGPALAQPANDACSNAVPLSLGVPVSGTTVDAGVDLQVTCAGDSADVWYSFTPAETAPYVFSVSGQNNFALSLSIISGCEFPIAEFACAPGTDKGASIEYQLFQGSPVLIRVGSSAPQTFTVSAQPAPPPPNDECSGAIPLSLGVPVPSSNLAATTTLELNNQSLCSSNAPGLGGGADVFFSFTPDQDGFYDFSTCGSVFDTVISVHSACPVSAANALACNDNAPLPACTEPFDTYSAYVSGAHLLANTTYYIRVAGVRIYNPFTHELEGPGRGNFTMTALLGSEPVVPANDTCANAETVFPGSQAFGTSVNATSDRGPTCGDNDIFDVWYQLTSSEAVPTVYRFTIDPGSFNTQATLSAYHACGEEPFTCDAYNPLSNPDMTLYVAVDPGQTVKIRVAGQQATQDQFTLTVTSGGPAAGNTTCDSAQALSVNQTVVADTAGANTDQASVCGFSDNAPLWYSFTATTAGYYRFATDFERNPDAGLRSTLSLYRACGEDAIACTQGAGEDAQNPDAAQLAVRMNAGETLYSRVSFEAPYRGPMNFSVSGPLPTPPAVPNDTCAGATPINAMPFSTSQDITLATPDQDVCFVEGQPLQPTPGGVWFSYRPSVEQVFRGRAEIAGRGIPARISVFSGSCGSLTQVGCPTNGFPGDNAIVLSANTTYSILVSLQRSREGEFEEIPYGTTLDIDFVSLPRPANDHCQTAQRVTTAPTTLTFNTLAADADGPMPTCIGFDSALQNAVWFTLTPTTSGTLTVEGRGSDPTEGLYSPGGVLYSGSCGGLTEVACDSPLNGWFITREFEFTAELTAGTTYYLAVGSYARPMGGQTEVSIGYTGELGCAADFNADGSANSQDFFDFLTAFFALAPNADFNSDGTVNSQDFFDFLGAFFTGC